MDKRGRQTNRPKDKKAYSYSQGLTSYMFQEKKQENLIGFFFVLRRINPLQVI